MRRAPLLGSLVVIAIFASLAVYILVGYLESPKVSTIVLPEFSKVYSIVPISNSLVALGGVKLVNNSEPYGIVALYSLQNGSCDVLSTLSNYFKGGYVYAVGFNGTDLLVGGDERINGTLHASLVDYNLHTHEVVNLSGVLSPFYTTGQVFSISWTGTYWLVGGDAYIIGFSGQPYIVPFLIEIGPKGDHDLSPQLPEPMRVLGGTSAIYTISSHGGVSIVAGGNAINMTASLFNGTNFTSVTFPYIHLGVLLASTWWDGMPILGGENLTQPNTPEPYLAEVVNYTAFPVSLEYKIGTVSAIVANNGKLYVALRTPFETSNGLTFGTVILETSNLKSFNTVLTRAYTAVDDIIVLGNEVIAVGYELSTSSNSYEGILLVLS